MKDHALGSFIHHLSHRNELFFCINDDLINFSAFWNVEKFNYICYRIFSEFWSLRVSEFLD